MQDDEQPSKYAIALEVLDELLPEHSFMGPAFDSRIQQLRNRIDWVCRDMLEHLQALERELPDKRPALAIYEMEEMLKADVDELTSYERRLNKMIDDRQDEQNVRNMTRREMRNRPASWINSWPPGFDVTLR
jgi:hypothetical protein